MKKNSDTCIIFIHKGSSWYLYYTIKQARKFNPDSEIVLLSDKKDKILSKYCRILSIEDYQDSANKFGELYEHNSFNSYEFELFCFQRWFVMNEFIKRSSYERFVHLDSDILCFEDFGSEFSSMKEAQLGIVGYQGPFSMLIPNKDIIDEFCTFINHLFTEEKAELSELYESWKSKTEYTAVSDMHALREFTTRKCIKLHDLSQVISGSTYDNVISASDGYRMNDRGIKDISWKGNSPFCVELSTQTDIRFKTLHCQGNQKNEILRLFCAKDINYHIDKLRLKLRKFFREKSS